MKTRFAISVVTAMMACFPLVASSEDRADPASGTEFASTIRCTKQSPCQNVTGEILRIEEVYLIRETNGREISMKVVRGSHMIELPKVGDYIAAQMTSNGEVQSIGKVSRVREREDIPVPSGTQGGLR